MKRLTFRTAALALALAASHQTVLSYRITYNSGPDNAKSNINFLVFTDAKDYAKLVKEHNATDTAQKILNTAMNAQGLLVSECAPEFAPEEYVLDVIGDIIIGWIFGFVKRIETDIATIKQHRQQKTGDVMSWTPSKDQLDPQGWIFLVLVIAKNDQKEKGQAVINLRIKPDAEFGLNITYDPNVQKKNGKKGSYKCTFEPAMPTDDADLAAYILNKDSLVRLHGLELGTPTQASNIEASLCDWSLIANPLANKAYADANIVGFNSTSQEYDLLKCPKMKSFISTNFVDAWPGWQKTLTQAIAIQKKQPGNATYNNFNNMTGQDMAKKVQGIQTYGGGAETAATLTRARNDAIAKNGNKTNICQ